MTEGEIAASVGLVVWTYIVFRIGRTVGRASLKERNLMAPPPPPQELNLPESLAEHDRREIERAFNQGRKIEAVRLLREATGLGLKEARQVLDKAIREGA